MGLNLTSLLSYSLTVPLLVYKTTYTYRREIPTGHPCIQIFLLLILSWWLSLVKMGNEWNKIVKRAEARKKQYFRNGMDSVRAKPLESCLANRENVMINRSRAC